MITKETKRESERDGRYVYRIARGVALVDAARLCLYHSVQHRGDLFDPVAVYEERGYLAEIIREGERERDRGIRRCNALAIIAEREREREIHTRSNKNNRYATTTHQRAKAYRVMSRRAMWRSGEEPEAEGSGTAPASKSARAMERWPF